MPEAIIRTEQLTRRFGGVCALDGLDLEVPQGNIFGFLGPNGAGKTTTIRLLLGLLEPTSGTAVVLGADIRREAQAVRERAGALLEHSGLYERLSAEDNLDFFGRVWKMSASDRQDRIRELLEPLGLFERRREPVGTWSRGMKQKLAVARALFHRPALLFLDEPTAGLDPIAAAALRDDLVRLVAQEGTTVFLTTHNLSEAERMCPMVAVIKQGRLLAVGHPDTLRARGSARCIVSGRKLTSAMAADLRSRPDVVSAELVNERLLVELREPVAVAPLVHWLVGAGADIEEVRRDSASLEDVFLTLMEEDR